MRAVPPGSSSLVGTLKAVPLLQPGFHHAMHGGVVFYHQRITKIDLFNLLRGPMERYTAMGKPAHPAIDSLECPVWLGGEPVWTDSLSSGYFSRMNVLLNIDTLIYLG